MAYEGYLLKFGNTELPNRFIKYNTFLSTPCQRQDLDSYEDADGYLHRTVLEHTRTKIEWNTPPMRRADKNEMMNIFQSAYENEAERKVSVTYYDDESDSYKTGTFYMPDIQFTYYSATDTDILYDSNRISIIEY